MFKCLVTTGLHSQNFLSDRGVFEVFSFIFSPPGDQVVLPLNRNYLNCQNKRYEKVQTSFPLIISNCIYRC